MVALSNLSSAITSSSSPDSVRLRVAADCDSIATAIAVATASGVLLNDYFSKSRPVDCPFANGLVSLK